MVNARTSNTGAIRNLYLFLATDLFRTENDKTRLKEGGEEEGGVHCSAV